MIFRKFLAAALAALLLLGCAGCGGGAGRAPAAPDAAIAAAPETGGSQAQEQGTGGEGSGLSLQNLVSNSMRDFYLTSQSGEGFYYIEPNAQDSLTGTIRYIDYAAGLDVPLSAQVNSEHTSEEDTAYLDSIIGNYRVFWWDGQLYFMRAGASGYLDSGYGEKAAAAVYRMEPDGSNRRLLWQGDASGDLMMWAAVSGDTLYLMRRGTENCLLFSVPLAGGEAREAAVLPGQLGTVLGCSGQRVYYWDLEGYNEGKNGRIGWADAVTGETGELLTLSNANGVARAAMAGQKILVYYDRPEPIEVYTLEGTLEKTIPLEGAVSRNTSVRAATVLGDGLFIAAWDNDTMTGMNLVIDLAAGTVRTSSACLTQLDGKDPIAVQIVGESADEYLAITEVRETTMQMAQGDGTTAATQVERDIFSLMPKADFCAETPTVRPIQRVD